MNTRSKEYDEVILTFPDGRYVGPGDLTEWLQQIEAADIPDEDKDVARGIVLQIRMLSN
jgi:hypothetical protein